PSIVGNRTGPWLIRDRGSGAVTAEPKSNLPRPGAHQTGVIASPRRRSRILGSGSDSGTAPLLSGRRLIGRQRRYRQQDRRKDNDGISRADHNSPLVKES